MDTQHAWIIARMVAGMNVEDDLIANLPTPWLRIAQAVSDADGRGRITVLQEMCAEMSDGETILKTILEQNPRRSPRKKPSFSLVPSLPSSARMADGLAEGVGIWLDQYISYAKSVSPLTPDIFHEAGGLWLVSLAIARRLVLRLAHKDLFPNLAILQIAPTTLYAKSTGLNIPRFLAGLVMRYLLLPGEMTPEAMMDELAGKQPVMLDGLDMADWQKGQAYAAQRGVCLDEASSLFVGLSKDYNIGMGEALLRLYDCSEYISRQTRGTGRSTVRNAYWTFLGATTPWHLKKADVDTLWYTGLWPRFLLITPESGPIWQMPSRTRTEMPKAIQDRLSRLCEDDLPESTYQKPAKPLGVGLGEGVFKAYQTYLQATMHTLLVPPTSVDIRLWGVYGRLAEHTLKVSILLAALDWNGVGAPVIALKHWARAQNFIETCRASAHRLPGMLAESRQNEAETKILMWLDASEDEWNTARDIYRGLNMQSSKTKVALLDLEEADLVESKQKGKAMYYRLNRENELSYGT